MQVSGIGGVSAGAGGLGPVSGVAAADGTAMSQAAGAAGSSTLEGSMPASLQSLMELLDGFSTAEILLALMLMSATGKDNDDSKSSDAASGFLAGLALAGQMGQSPQIELNIPIQNVELDGGLGAAINFVS